MPDYKEKAALEFATALVAMRVEAVRRFAKFKNLPTDKLLFLITSEMENFVLNTLNFQGDINKLMNAYVIGLEGMYKFAPVSKMVLESLRSVETKYWSARIVIESTALQKEILNATITKSWDQKAIVERLTKGMHGALTPAQVETNITTALSNFERNVRSAMMNEMPEDTKYIYIGPQDAKTRDFCNEMLGAGELTKDEIISSFGGDVLSVGGGFNCRHSWDLV